jgi:hypothetical protein
MGVWKMDGKGGIPIKCFDEKNTGRLAQMILDQLVI